MRIKETITTETKHVFQRKLEMQENQHYSNVIFLVHIILWDWFWNKNLHQRR